MSTAKRLSSWTRTGWWLRSEPLARMRESSRARIRRGTSDYADEVRVPPGAGGEETLGLPARRARELRTLDTDEIDAWHGVIAATLAARWWVATVVLVVAAAVVLGMAARKARLR